MARQAKLVHKTPHCVRLAAGGDHGPAQRAAWQSAHEAGARTYVSCYEGTLGSVGDLLDLAVLSGKPDPEEARRYHAIGHRVFCYGFPQVAAEEPETYRRNYGLELWKAGFDGAMPYAYQQGFGHIWNDFDDKTSRDHVFAHPTGDGVVDTVQWEGFREAADDVRYMATLERAIGQAPAARQQTAADARKWLDALDAAGDLYEIRERAVEWIVKLQ